MAGRVLGRFWQAALDANSAAQGLALRAEVEYITYVELLLETGLTAFMDASLVLLLPNLGSVSHSLVSHLFELMFPHILTSLILDRYNMMLHDVAARADGMCSITAM